MRLLPVIRLRGRYVALVLFGRLLRALPAGTPGRGQALRWLAARAYWLAFTDRLEQGKR